MPYLYQYRSTHIIDIIVRIILMKLNLSHQKQEHNCILDIYKNNYVYLCLL